MNFKEWLALVEADNNPMMQTVIKPLDQQATLANTLGDTKIDQGSNPSVGVFNRQSGKVTEPFRQAQGYEDKIAALYRMISDSPPDKETLKSDVAGITQEITSFLRQVPPNRIHPQIQPLMYACIGQLIDLKNGLDIHPRFQGEPYNQKEVAATLLKAHDFLARARILMKGS